MPRQRKVRLAEPLSEPADREEWLCEDPAWRNCSMDAGLQRREERTKYDASTEDEEEGWADEDWSDAGSIPENAWNEKCRMANCEEWTEEDDATHGSGWEMSEQLRDASLLSISGDGAYRKIRHLGGGAFGEVYCVNEVATGQVYAAKLEDEEYTLSWEAEMLDRVKGLPGFPAVRHYSEESGALLVMDLLGPNLSELQARCGNRFSLKTVLMIGDQALQRLEDLHSKGIVHRDIKPENFTIGRGDSSDRIYAIDLGLANEYCDRHTGRHIPFRKGVEFSGTVEYSSSRAQAGVEQSRRDDLEALGYMLIGLLQGKLPWQQHSDKTYSDQEWYDHCAKQKSLMLPSMICAGCPKEFEKYLQYCKSLKFSDQPDYQYLRDLFRAVFIREAFVNDGRFDWSAE